MRTFLLGKIHWLCEAVSIARALFFLNHISDIKPLLSEAPPLRIDAVILSLSSALGTQGFELTDLELSENEVKVVVRDVTRESLSDRMLHSSQFVFPVWKSFRKDSVSVTYLDKDYEAWLTTTASGLDCQAVFEEVISFNELAHRVNFQPLKLDDATAKLGDGDSTSKP